MAELNQWEIALEEQLKQLKECQERHKFKSCLPCPELNKCALRDEYVKAVYDSMSKGKGGGFEF